MVSLQIDELPDIIREDVEDFLETHPRSPAAQWRPKLGVIGSVWLAYVDTKLARGASGLGQTIARCAGRFQSALMEPFISRNSSEAH